MSFVKVFLSIAILSVFSTGIVLPQEIRYIDESKVGDTLQNGAMQYKINDSLSYVYTRPVPFSFFKHSAQDIYLGTKNVFRKESILPVLGITGSTLLLIVFDDKIIDAVHRFGNYIGIPGTDNTLNISPVKNLPIYIPSDISSGLYYIGDGLTEILVDGGFYCYGLIKQDNRALTTASELSEGMIAVGVTVQILKHISGREDPYERTAPSGRWQWFPSISDYQNHVPHYDAFPSGHLSTAMMTTTIISLNYPEYKFIKPLCYTLMGLCGFQMLNNGVHWMSDYPLALAIGYSFGKIAVARGRMQEVKDNKNKLSSEHKQKIIKSFDIHPTYLGYGAAGLSLNMTFQ